MLVDMTPCMRVVNLARLYENLQILIADFANGNYCLGICCTEEYLKLAEKCVQVLNLIKSTYFCVAEISHFECSKMLIRI